MQTESFDTPSSSRRPTRTTLRRVDAPVALLRPARLGLTGTLKLVDGAAVRALGFSAGAPTIAVSSLPEERLGSHLLAKGVIDVGQAVEAEQVMAKDGVGFGTATISLGLLERVQVAQRLTELHESIIAEALLVDDQVVSFGPLGNLAGRCSRISLLNCVEMAVRRWPPEEIEATQARFRSDHFIVPETERALADRLGASQAVQQIIEWAGTARSFDDLFVASDDDRPEVPILTLLLTDIAVRVSR